MTEPAAGGRLYVVATPIGHLQDISLRALEVLAAVDLLACEDTRITARLLERHGLLPLKTVAFHAHNEHRQVARLVERLQAGDSVALLTDAGMPSISDPGLLLVREARLAGVSVTVLPGPSAVLTALVASGLPAERFTFTGFLPPRRAARQRQISLLAALPHTLVLFESPRRLAGCLADLAALLGPRQAAVARELTKIHEEVRVDTLDRLAAEYAGRDSVRGEVTVVIGPPAAGAPGMGCGETVLPPIAEHYQTELERRRGDSKEAMRAVARARGVARRQVYRALLDAGILGDGSAAGGRGRGG